MLCPSLCALLSPSSSPAVGSQPSHSTFPAQWGLTHTGAVQMCRVLQQNKILSPRPRLLPGKPSKPKQNAALKPVLKCDVNYGANQGGTTWAPGALEALRCHSAELRNCTRGVFSPGQLCFGTKHFLCRRELAERLVSFSHDLLLKLPIKWKYVILKSFICLLSFSNAAFLWTYTYLMRWNIDVYPEMRSDEAVSYTKWIKFPTEMSFVSSAFCTFGMYCTWMGSEGWVTAVEYS